MVWRGCVCVWGGGGWGDRGIRSFISGKQRNQSLKLMRTGDQRQFWGIRNITNQDFDFWEQGKMSIFFQGNKGTGTPHSPLREPLFFFQEKIRNLLDIVQLTY